MRAEVHALTEERNGLRDERDGLRNELQHKHDELAAARDSLDAAAADSARASAVRVKLEAGFQHMIGANAVFEIEDFLQADALVCASHVFCAAGFEWKLWVKPYSGPNEEHVGLYLTPAEDLDQVYTADYALAIVGRQGHILQRALDGGRPKLQGRKAGHGWPTFVTRSELEASATDPASCLLQADGRLIVTCSGLSNVRPRMPQDDAAGLARTL